MSWPTGSLPVLALRNTVMFPFVAQAIKVGRDQSRKAVERAMGNGGWILAVAQKSPDITPTKVEDFYVTGVLCKIDSVKKLSDGSLNLILRGQKRCELRDLKQETESYWTSEFTPLETMNKLDKAMLEGLRQSLIEISHDALKPDSALEQAFSELESLEELSFFTIANADLKVQDKMKVLELLDLRESTMEILRLLSDVKMTHDVQDEIRKKLYSRFGQTQREQILREQMRTIQEELGEKSKGTSPEDYQKKIDELNLPQAARDLAEQQARRLEQINSASPDYHVTKNHLDFLLSLPWNKSSGSLGVDLEAARAQLDQDHFGLDKIKKRILQSLSVLKLTGGKRGSLLMFLGPPGVGKTSLGQSIAKALNRKFERVSLGGVRDEAEIRGHRRTYVGAMPGRILNSIKKAGERDPVILLDEIDKMSHSFSGDPASAFLEVLDPEQNVNFSDHYLETPFDLSQVLFIATANSLEGIPGPLLDRMEVIELGSYTNLEKLEIAEKHLWPKAMKDHGLSPEHVQLPRSVIEKLVSLYTREAGVRDLQRKLMQICRYATEKVVLSQEKHIASPALHVQVSDLEEIFSGERIFTDKEELHRGPGVVAGLAWTPVGGDLLFIESAQMPGHGKLVMTGKLGEVMRESAELALSLLRSRMALWKGNFDFSKHDLHLHAPAGAIPKDGPSAGVTILTSLASLIMGKSVAEDQAMTGEITLTGAVLPVGGIKEKLMAAHRYGRKRVLIPAANERDLQQLPKEVREDLKVYLAHNVEEVLQWALGFESVKQSLLHSLDTRVSGLTTPDL